MTVRTLPDNIIFASGKLKNLHVVNLDNMFD